MAGSPAVNWRKSSRSGGQSNCVEIPDNMAANIAVRDSKDPDGPTLAIAPVAWASFVNALCTGTLDS